MKFEVHVTNFVLLHSKDVILQYEQWWCDHITEGSCPRVAWREHWEYQSFLTSDQLQEQAQAYFNGIIHRRYRRSGCSSINKHVKRFTFMENILTIVLTPCCNCRYTASAHCLQCSGLGHYDTFLGAFQVTIALGRPKQQHHSGQRHEHWRQCAVVMMLLMLHAVWSLLVVLQCNIDSLVPRPLHLEKRPGTHCLCMHKIFRYIFCKKLRALSCLYAEDYTNQECKAFFS